MNSSPAQSLGHVAFVGRFEYFLYEENLYRAPIDCPIRVDVPIRNGARFESPAWQADDRIAAAREAEKKFGPTTDRMNP